MWLLPEWADHDCDCSAKCESTSDRRADHARDELNPVPLHDVLPHSRRDQARSEGDSRRANIFARKGGRMTTFTSIPKQIKEVMEKRSGASSRRDFLKGSGLFVVSFSAVAMTDATPLRAASMLQTGLQASGVAQAAGPYPDPDFRKLDSWDHHSSGQHSDFLRR